MRRTLSALAAAAVVLVAASPAFATGNGHKPVTVCHKPGTPAEKQLTVDEKAVKAHLKHGDHKGVCVPVTTTTTVPEVPTSTTTSTMHVPVTTTTTEPPPVTSTTATTATTTPADTSPSTAMPPDPSSSSPNLGCTTDDGFPFVTNIEQGGCPTTTPSPIVATNGATSAPTELPRTGRDAGWWTCVALALLIVGLTFWSASKVL